MNPRQSRFGNPSQTRSEIRDLRVLALFGMVDPPRPEAREAIASCRRAGIAVKMITGDHPDTASAIARGLGLEGGVLTGAQLETLSEEDLSSQIDGIAVFARVAPEHKVRIVQALKAQGHVVAMTGDGVNDAPALKNADIGIVMGRTGTEVAKEAATMVIMNDNFATITAAIWEGRALYDNIIKFVRFQLSTTIAAIMTVFTAPLLGLPDPLTPIQILWVAMIMDGPPAVALALDSPRPGLMHEPPRRPDAQILSGHRLGQLLVFGTTITAGTQTVLWYGLRYFPPDYALTMAFTTFVLFQVFNVFNARAERGTSFNKRFFDNRMLWLSLIAVVALQALAIYWRPASEVFGTVPMAWTDLGIAFAVASNVLILEEGRKLVTRLCCSRFRARQKG
jgi:Ca2+-transporting ATPase